MLERVVPAAVLLASCTAPATGQRTIVLSDTASNTHLEDFHTSAAETGLGEGWSVRRETLRGGKQESVDRIVIDTGVIRAEVLPTRGMSIHHLRVAGQRIGWDSPSEEIVHPALIDLESRGGLGWLEGFNEWMVRCGLEFAGHPGEDVLVDNTGAESRMDLTLHGRIGNLPASRVELSIDEQPPHRIRLRGTVFERTFYGPKLRLDTELSMVPGERTWRLTDTVTNVGGAPQEFQIIYHGNYGPPLLGEGSRLVAAARTVAPMNGNARDAIEGWSRYLGPTPGFSEEVYLIEPHADEAGRTSVLLVAPGGEVGTTVSWILEELPYFTQWKNTAALEDGYVTGLEPGTGFPFNRRVEREAGRVPVLAPGTSRTFTLDYAVQLGATEVEEAEDAIRTIQAGREPVILDVPD